MEKKVHGVADS